MARGKTLAMGRFLYAKVEVQRYEACLRRNGGKQIRITWHGDIGRRGCWWLRARVPVDDFPKFIDWETLREKAKEKKRIAKAKAKAKANADNDNVPQLENGRYRRLRTVNR